MTSPLLLSMATLLVILDLVGTFVFALSGAVSGVKHRSICSVCSCCRSRRATPAA